MQEETKTTSIQTNDSSQSDKLSSSPTTTTTTFEKNHYEPPPPPPTIHYECDYLVVGAGTCGMSFIDTLLTENTSATIILIDRNDKPGGHWTTAYPFVQLHQPGGYYGVNSEPLGKKFNPQGYETICPHDRATGEEIVAYYGRVLEKFQTKSNRRFQAFFECEYGKEEYSIASTMANVSSSTVHSIVTSSGDVIYIRCRKIVMITSKVIVPSMRKETLFPVHKDVQYKCQSCT